MNKKDILKMQMIFANINCCTINNLDIYELEKRLKLGNLKTSIVKENTEGYYLLYIELNNKYILQIEQNINKHIYILGFTKNL